MRSVRRSSLSIRVRSRVTFARVEPAGIAFTPALQATYVPTPYEADTTRFDPSLVDLRDIRLWRELAAMARATFQWFIE